MANMSKNKTTKLTEELKNFKLGKIGDKYYNDIRNTNEYYHKDSGINYKGQYENEFLFGPSGDTNLNSKNKQNSRESKTEENNETVAENEKKNKGVYVKTSADMWSKKDDKTSTRNFVLDIDKSEGSPDATDLTAYGDVALSSTGAKITRKADKVSDYEEKYKDYDYSKLKAEADKTDKSADNGWLKEWLNSKADEKATSSDLQAEYDALAKEYNNLYEKKDETESYNRLKEIENRQLIIETLIDKKKYDETVQEKYYNVIQNDVKVGTVLQKYYALNKGLEQNGANIDEAVNKNFDFTGFSYTPEEQEKIKKDFAELNKKYDANELYKYYVRETEEKFNQDELERLKQETRNNPLRNNINSVFLNTYGTFADMPRYIGAGIDKIMGGDGYIDTNTTSSKRASVIRETTSENMNDTQKFWYNTAMGIADNVARIPLRTLGGENRIIGETASQMVASSSAFSSDFNEVADNGGDLTHAFATGVASALIEWWTEGISEGNYSDILDNGTDSFLKSFAKSIGTEGSEESISQVLGTVADNLINQNKSQMSLQYQNYISQGYSSENALNLVWSDFGKQVVESALSGGISGGVLSGGTMLVSYGGYKLTQRDVENLRKNNVTEVGKEAMASEDFDINQLIFEAKNSGNKKAEKIATAVEKSIEKNKGTSKSTYLDVGNLIFLLSTDRPTANYDVENVDKQELIDKNYNLSGELKTNADIESKENADTSDTVKYKDTNAFGKQHPHGIAVKTNSGGELTIVGVLSSAKDYDASDNNVILLADNGTRINADDVSVSLTPYGDLFSYAKNFDTLGARSLVSQYEDYAEWCKERGVSPDTAEYAKAYEDLYSLGKMGVTYENIKKSGSYTKAINTLGGVAYSATQSGNNDINISRMDESNKMQKIRVPGERNSVNSKMYIEPGAEQSVIASSEQLNMLQAVAVKTGKDVVLTDDLQDGVNGCYANGKIYIKADLNENYMLAVALHEATHGLRQDSPLEYQALCEFVTNYLVAKGVNIKTLLEDIKIKWGSKVSTSEDLLEEVVCQTVMSIASDEKAIQTALGVKENKNILEKVVSSLKKIAADIKKFIKENTTNLQAKAWLEDAKAIQNLAEKLSSALDSAKNETTTSTEQKNNTAVDSDAKYSIRYTKENKPVVVVEENILQGIPKKQWVKTVKNVMSEKFSDGIPVKGRFIKVNRISRNEYTNSKNTKYLRDTKGNIYVDKLKTANNLDEIILASTNYINEDLKHKRKDGFKEFARGEVLLKIGENEYKSNVIIGYNSANEMVLYDIIDFIPAKFALKKESTPYGRKPIRNGMLSNDNIPQTNGNVNIQSMQENKKYSMRDSEYLEAVKNNDMETAQRLVDEAAERAFAESKIRDEDGKLLKVYHGTPKDFTVFRNSGSGMYFTADPDYARGYTQLNGKMLKTFLNIKKPFDILNDSIARKIFIDEFIKGGYAQGIHPSSTLTEINKYIQNGVDWVEGDNLIEFLEENEYDYDGLIINEGSDSVATATGNVQKWRGYSYVTFNSEQIKSADPVTYDDNGNVISLSERFNDSQKDIRYQFAGRKSETANIQKLDKAIELENEGKQSEYIRQITGWFRGYDGKWKFEINDSDMKFRAASSQDKANAVDYIKNTLRFKDLENKINNDTVTEAEEQEYYDLDDAITKYETGSKLSDYMKHPELFKAYPQLKDLKIYFRQSVNKGEYNSSTKTIIINPMNSAKVQREALIHEVQHAIQDIEGFAKGSSVGYWQEEGYSFNDSYDRYQRTAGEIEARDTAQRIDYTDEQRKNIQPDIYRTDAILKEGTMSYNSSLPFDKQVDAALKGKLNKRNALFVSDTSEILLKIGMKQLPMLYTQNHLSDAIKPKSKNSHRHGLTVEQIKYMPEVIENPTIIMDSMSNDKDIVLVSDKLNDEGAPIILIVRPNGIGVYELVTQSSNFILSYYGKDNNFENYIGRAISDDKILYINKKKSQSLYQQIGLQLPNGFNKLGFDKIIHQSNNIVKHDVTFEKNADLKFAFDDTVYDYITDEYGTPDSHLDLQKIMLKNPNAAVAMIYRNSVETAQKGMYLSESIQLNPETYREIARKVLIDLGVNVQKHGKEVGEFSKSIKHLVERSEQAARTKSGTNSEYFRNLFEDFVDVCSDYVTISKFYDTKYRKDVRDYVYGMISDNVLVIRDYDLDWLQRNYGSVQEYRSRLFGKTKVGMESNGRTGYYIEDVVDFVKKKYPKLVNESVEVDGGFRWLDLLLNDYLEQKMESKVESKVIKGYYENKDSAGIEAAFNAINCIFREKINVGVKEKDISRNVVNQLNEKFKASTEEMRELKKAKIRISELEEKLDKRDSVIERGMDVVRSEYIEARMRTVERNKLLRKLNSFTKLFNSKSNKNYIPDVLQQPILNVLKSVTLNRGTYRDGRLKNPPKAYSNYQKKLIYIEENIKELADSYETMRGKQPAQNDYLYFDTNSIGFEEETLGVLKELEKQLKGKNIYELSAEDLRNIYDTINMLDRTLKSAVEIIVDGNKAMIQELSEKAIDELKTVNSKAGGDGILGTLKMGVNQFVTTSLDPVRFGRRLSGYHDDFVINKLFGDVHFGEKKAQRIEMEAFLPIEAVASKLKNKTKRDFQLADIKEFDFRDIKTGKRVKVSQSMILSLYMTARQDDGYRHLVNDEYNHYTVIPDLDLINRDNLVSDIKKDKQRALNSNMSAHKVRFTKSDIEKIKSYVEKNDILKDFVTAMDKTFSEIIATEINNVSMQKYGRKIAVIRNYFPIKVDPNNPNFNKNVEPTNVFSDYRLRSCGFTKHRTSSTQPIIIDDALNVLSKHVKEASKYCGLLIPIENLKKICNSGNGEITVKGIIENKFGEPATHYINKLMGDLQNTQDTDFYNLLTKIQGNYMGAKLLGNFSATLKNISAFPTANNYFGTKNVTIAATVGVAKQKQMYDTYSKYTPYLWYRKQGNGTVIGELSRDAGFYKKATDYIDIMSKVDTYVVGSLLYAAELHVEQTTDLKRGTEAFYKEVVRQWEKCIDETQPNNMVTSKPQFLRNKAMKILSFDAFRSQVLAIGNTLIDSAGEYSMRKAEYKALKNEEAKSAQKNEEAKSAKKNATKKFAKVLIGVIESHVLNSVLQMIVDVLFHKWDDYKDEEGEVTAVTILTKFLDYFGDNFAGMFIWGDTAYETICTAIDHDRFFGLEVMSIETINDGIEKALKGDLLGFLTLFTDCFTGLPTETLVRYVKSIFSYVNDAINGYGEIITNNNGKTDTTYFNYIIVSAKQNGETEKAEHYEEMWKDDLINNQGKTDEQATDIIKSKLVTALARSDDDVEDAAIAMANGNLDIYEEHMNKVVEYGFDSKDVKKAVDKVIKNIATNLKDRNITEKSDVIAELKEQGFNDKGCEYVYKEMQSSTNSNSEESVSVFVDTSDGEGVAYTYSDAFEALKSGDKENYEHIKQYLIDEAGKEEKDVTSAMRSASRTDKLWAEYIQAYENNDKDTMIQLKEILTNIYGSWGTAKTYMYKYQKRMKEKD